MSWYYNSYPRYVSAAEKRMNAGKLAAKMASKGQILEPATVTGTKLASSFWAQSWNRNLERYQDYSNRLPRGRSYLKNGAVIDLKVEKGCIKAQVSGSDLYQVVIHIQPLKPERWKALKRTCSGQISSLIGLLQGKIPPSVMEAVTKQGEGLFPEPCDIRFSCTCPDYADLCKHVSAAVYGVGARLDHRPELLFLLRGVDHTDLIAGAGDAVAAQADVGEGDGALEDLSGIFGIDLEDSGNLAPTGGALTKKKPHAQKSQKTQSAKPAPKSRKRMPTKAAKKTLKKTLKKAAKKASKAKR